MVDTGAAISCISTKFARKYNVYVNPNSHIQPLFTADGGNLDVSGTVILTVTLGNCNVQHEFHIVKNFNHSIVFGIDFLQKTRSHIDLSSDFVSFYDGRIFLPLQTFQENSVVLRATKFVFISAKSQVLVLVKMAKKALCNF